MVSKCCGAEMIEDFKSSICGEPIAIYTCAKCKCECEEKEACDVCLGSGTVAKMVKKYGSNLPPGGFWDMSEEETECPFCKVTK